MDIKGDKDRMSAQLLKTSVLKEQTEDPILTLNKQWYNAIVTGCHLDDQQFQLSQGSVPLVKTNDLLWNLLDAIPPKSINSYYDPSQANFFAGNYGSVLSKLVSPVGTKLNTFLGDTDYNSLLTGFKSRPDKKINLRNFFKNWCQENCPDKCSGGSSILAQADLDPVFLALQKFDDATEGNKGYAYTTTIDFVEEKIKNESSATATFDSEHTSSDVTNTWAAGQANTNAFYFSDQNQQYQDLHKKITQSHIKVTVQFDHLMTVQAGPLDKPMPDTSVLKDCIPWYLSSVLGIAYKNDDKTVWQEGQHPNWNDTFGDNGGLLRRTSGLILVNGIDVEITIEISLEDSEFESFKEASSKGFWPFYRKDSSSGWDSNTYTYEGQTLKVQMKCPGGDGNTQILGILQTAAPKYFS